MQVSKSLLVLCIFGLLALPLMGVASAQNLLPNGDFETGDLTGWETFSEGPNATITVVTPGNGPSFGGVHHAFLNNQQEALNLGFKASTPVGSAGPGTVYYFMDLLLEEVGVGGVAFVEIFAEEGPDGGVIGTSGLIAIGGPVGEWQIVQGNFEAPAGTSFLTFQFVAATGAVSGSTCLARVDNFYLGQAGPPVATEDMSMGSIKALFR